jgi:SAM-dependent methyltransferase
MRKILEIGGGTTPYFIRFEVPQSADSTYVCLDMNEKRLKQSKEALEAMRRRGAVCPSAAEFTVHDGTSLPFPDASCEEVVLSNVLSAPIHYHWDKKGENVLLRNESGVISRPIRGSKSDGDLFFRERKPLISEAMRVLKPGGQLTVYTDLLIYGQHSYEKILRDLAAEDSVEYRFDSAEGARIDTLNEQRKKGGKYCYCFDADLLPESSVHRFVKIR